MPTRRTVLAPQPPAGGGGGPRGGRSGSAVGEPGRGAAILSQQPAARGRGGAVAGPPPAPGGRAVAPIPFGGVDPLYAVGSDGLLHTLSSANGADMTPPVPFLPPNTKPSALIFVYRSSPRYMVPQSLALGGGLSWEDPPRTVSGMITITLEPSGRLVWFEAVPPQWDPSPEVGSKPDWTALLAEAGLTTGQLKEVAPIEKCAVFAFKRLKILFVVAICLSLAHRSFVINLFDCPDEFVAEFHFSRNDARLQRFPQFVSRLEVKLFFEPVLVG